MINKRVLIVAPYPIAKPQHGGQKRAAAIFEFYKKQFAEVKFVAIVAKDRYPEYGPDDLCIGDERLLAKIEENPHGVELVIGEAVYKDPSIRTALNKLLQSYRPDIVQIEQMYPFLGMEPLLRDLGMRPRIILSSHNIESQMKREMFANLRVPAEIARPVVGAIRDLEAQASKGADLVVAVSERDARVHYHLGAKRCVVAQNGIAKITPSDAAKEKWQQMRQDERITAMVSFVGSAHPPNWMGFVSMLGQDLSYLPKGAKILIAGGVAGYFSGTYKGEAGEYAQFWDSAIALGMLEEDDLAGLIDQSDIILLPITSGGGSNLKTAEAILSGKKIVATAYAFRSFEKYLTLPNIYLADDPEGFRKALVSAIDAPYVGRTAEQRKLAEQVRWDHCLKPIMLGMTKIVTPGAWAEAKRWADIQRMWARRVYRGVKRRMGYLR